MNEKLIVVLLLITIVLSITSMAIVFNMNVDVNFIKDKVADSPQGSANVGFTVEPTPEGGNFT